LQAGSELVEFALLGSRPSAPVELEEPDDSLQDGAVVLPSLVSSLPEKIIAPLY
jgi:hypothetical protein